MFREDYSEFGRYRGVSGGDKEQKAGESLAILGPLVLTTNLVLLLGSEVVLDVERLADLIGRLALDHVGNSLAADIEERLDVEVVGSLCWWKSRKSVCSNILTWVEL